MRSKHFRCSRVYAADIPSASQEGVVYRVSMAENRPHCSCPGYAYRQECKHTKALMEIACMWDSKINPRGCAHPVDGMCPMCGGLVVVSEDEV